MPETQESLLQEGEIHRRAGRLAEALACARQVLDADPESPGGLALMGLLCLQAGDAAGAVELLGRALHRDPLRPDWFNARGVAYQELGRAKEAEGTFRRALALAPADAAALNNLGSLLRTQGRQDEALEPLQKARLVAPDDPDVAANLAEVLLDLGLLKDLGPLLLEVLKVHPGHARSWAILAEAHQAVDNVRLALDGWRHATQADPGKADYHFALAALLAYIGDSKGAVASYRRTLDLVPDSPQVHSNLLMAMQYSDEIERTDLAAEHRRWAERHAPPPPLRPALRDPDPERRLRIGLVSGDFRFHALYHFFLEPLRRRDRDRWEAFLYSTGSAADAVTAAFRDQADGWRDAKDLNDNALFEAIRADGIDVLVDLNGHAKGNRLAVFAQRPAPVQASWMDYVDTTGLAVLDALIVDRHLVRPEEERFYAEPIRRLPDDAICFTPVPYAPEVTPPPFRRKGHITFGCFATAHKIGPGAVQAWAKVLDRVPGSRLLLNAGEFRHALVRQRYLDLFAAAGIGEGRLEFGLGGAHMEFLERYADVDIALDPFPYSGGLNTCEALWMGVPVVTFAGGRQSGRLAASHLHNAGLPELVAPDLETAIDLAAGLAGEEDRLRAYREELRPTLAASPLCDADRFIRNFEGLLRDLWREACTK